MDEKNIAERRIERRFELPLNETSNLDEAHGYSLSDISTPEPNGYGSYHTSTSPSIGSLSTIEWSDEEYGNDSGNKSDLLETSDDEKTPRENELPITLDEKENSQSKNPTDLCLEILFEIVRVVTR